MNYEVKIGKYFARLFAESKTSKQMKVEEEKDFMLININLNIISMVILILKKQVLNLLLLNFRHQLLILKQQLKK